MSKEGVSAAHDPKESSLFEFLRAKLLGSTLRVLEPAGGKIEIDVGDVLSLSITSDSSKKVVSFTLYSKMLKREITVEQFNGTSFLEARLENELEKEDRLTVEEDVLLAVDLITLWAESNGYSVLHSRVDGEESEK